MTIAKTLQMFLMDGTASGRVKCSLKNWTGRVFSIPRTAVKETKERVDLRQTGIYFLLGTDENSDQPAIYVGQSLTRQNGSGVLARVAEHLTEEQMSFFNRAILVITADNSYGPTEISYLENAFYNLAIEIDRYKVVNPNVPAPANVTEEQQAELEEFIEYTRLVVGALGVQAFEPELVPPSSKIPPNEENYSDAAEPTLYLGSSSSQFQASGQQTAEGFVVFKGSRIRPDTVPSCPKTVIQQRERLADRVVNNILQRNTLFKSPSAAAGFVSGSSINGRTTWKNCIGQTLSQIEAQEADEVRDDADRGTQDLSVVEVVLDD